MIRSALPLIMRNVWGIFTTQFLSRLLLHTRLNVMLTTIYRKIFMVRNFCGLIVEVKIMYHEKAVLMSHTCMNNHWTTSPLGLYRSYAKLPTAQDTFQPIPGLISCAEMMSKFQVCISSCKATNNHTVAQALPFVWLISHSTELKLSHLCEWFHTVQ